MIMMRPGHDGARRRTRGLVMVRRGVIVVVGRRAARAAGAAGRAAASAGRRQPRVGVPHRRVARGEVRRKVARWIVRRAHVPIVLLLLLEHTNKSTFYFIVIH